MLVSSYLYRSLLVHDVGDPDNFYGRTNVLLGVEVSPKVLKYWHCTP